MMLFGLVFRPVCTLDNDVASVPLLLFNLLVDNFSGVLLCVFMKCRHFPTFFCAGTKKKKYDDVADRACRPNFADIVGCRRHVGDMSPTCAAKISRYGVAWGVEETTDQKIESDGAGLSRPWGWRHFFQFKRQNELKDGVSRWGEY